MKNKNRAILLMLFSAFSFSAMQIIVKILDQIPLMEKVFFRNFISLILAYIVIKSKNLSLWGDEKNRKYLLGRSVFGYAGIILFFFATTKMLAADAAILNKLSPIFVIIFAHYFLKESINKIHILALILSFIGALFVIKPGFNSSIIPAAAGFFSAILSGAAYVFIAYIGKKESVYTVVFYFSLFSAICSVPFLIFSFAIPNLNEFMLLLLLGSLAAFGQIALTCAYNSCSASEISIYDYSNILFSAMLGYIFLSELSDFSSIIGGTLIIAASFIVFLYNKGS